MKYRKLRIAWSATWGVAAVLLIILWVRSYWWWEQLNLKLTATHGLVFWSEQGEFIATYLHGNPQRQIVGWRLLSFPPHYSMHPSLLVDAVTGTAFKVTSTSVHYHSPYWVLFSITIVAGVAAWIHQLSWRFSLRTLLIATTLVAVVLGLIVWSTNSVEMHALGGPLQITNVHDQLIGK